MALYVKTSDPFHNDQIINIISTEAVQNYTVYVIKVVLEHFHWIVKRRYTEFCNLHEWLVAHNLVEKAVLPPKKVFGNQNEDFIEKRRLELQTYLRLLLTKISKLPDPLVDFLRMDIYEIHGITNKLAEELYTKGDIILTTNDWFYTTPLQLHAICTRLTLAEPTCNSDNSRRDLGHVLDFCTNVKNIAILGSYQPLEASNIIPSELTFDLTHFKCVEHLQISSCDATKISGIENIKKTIKTIAVKKNSVKALKDLLLIDMGFGQWLGNSTQNELSAAWQAVTRACFKDNHLTYIDESVKLLHNVEVLDLSMNSLTEVQELQHLPCLSTVDLSFNCFSTMSTLHMKFGNIKVLILHGNKIESLQGFAKLYSLEKLTLTRNKIEKILEIDYLGGLPCLTHLNFQENPVTSEIDYRTKILEIFSERANEIILDGIKATQKELDHVAIRLALKKARPQNRVPQRQPIIADDGNSLTRQGSMQSTEVRYNESRSASPQANPASLTSSSTLMDSTIHNPSANIGQNFTHIQVTEHSSSTLFSCTEPAAQAEQIGNVTNPEDVFEVISEDEAHVTIAAMTGAATNTDSKFAQSRRYKYDVTEDIEETSSDSDGDNEDDVQTEGLIEAEMEIDLTIDTKFLLPEGLPKKTDANFITQLQSMTPNGLTPWARQNRQGGRTHITTEKAVYVVWTSAVLYSHPKREFQACVYITSDNIHLFEVKSLTSEFEMPLLTHIRAVPLVNIQQIVMGYDKQYVRIEEAFAKMAGTFTLLFGSSAKTDQFIDAIKLAFRRTVSEIDQYEDPYIIPCELTLTNLQNLLQSVTGQALAAEDVTIMQYLLVNSNLTGSHPFTTHSLVITPSYILLLRQDYILYPPTTFNLNAPANPQFQLVMAFPTSAQVLSCKLYDSDAEAQETFSLSPIFSATNSTAMINPNFVGFGLKVLFQGYPDKCLNIRVPTSNLRAMFLDCLTKAYAKAVRPKSVKKKVVRQRQVVLPGSMVVERPDNLVEGYQGLAKPQLISDQSNVSLHNDLKVKQNCEHESTVNIDELAQEALMEVADHSLPLITPGPSRLSTMEPTINTYQTDESHKESAKPCTSKLDTQSSHTYPTKDLLDYISICNAKTFTLKPLPTELESLFNMTGDELVNFFHNKIALPGIGNVSEELRYVLWCAVIPYSNPKQEITCCVVLTTTAIYFLSNAKSFKLCQFQTDKFKCHNRNKSDTQTLAKKITTNRDSEMHTSSGILYTSAQNGVRQVAIIPLTDIQAVHIGLFEQGFRLTGKSLNDVFFCLTRNMTATERSIQELMAALDGITASTSSVAAFTQVAPSQSDFYRTFGASYSRSESLEYIHPSSKVKFYYPNDLTVADLTIQIKRVISKQVKNIDILCYTPCYLCDTLVEPVLLLPRTVVITDQYFVLLDEDHVSYPVPTNLTKKPPIHSQYRVLQARNLEYLQYIQVWDDKTSQISFTFLDDCDDRSVSLEKCTTQPKQSVAGHSECGHPEITLTFLVQDESARNRLLKMLPDKKLSLL